MSSGVKMANDLFNNKNGSSIKLRDYQIEAIDSWFDNNCRGIFEMATGTGKTFTALSCYKKLSNATDRLLTVIACPQSHLIDQWVNEIKKFDDVDIVIASSKNSKWKEDLGNLVLNYFLEIVDKTIVLTTHASLSSDFFLEKIREFNSDLLLIVDEVHGIGSKKQMLGLDDSYNYRLGLSATPSRYFDDYGTEIINSYFDGVVFEFDITRALTEFNPDSGKTYLTPYIYNPIIVNLNDEELALYSEYSAKVAYLYATNKTIDDGNKTLTSYLIKRQNIINNAEEKYDALVDILRERPDIDKLLVFCSSQQIDRVQEILNEEGVSPQHKFTQNQSARKKKKEDLSEREYLLKKFEDGSYKALVAIKCLDEGVDVPSAENAIIMSSTSNPREHVQRRGRILRNSPGKEKAIIYDILVFPEEKTEVGRKIRDKEINRYVDFATDAENSWECLKLLKKVGDW